MGVAVEVWRVTHFGSHHGSSSTLNILTALAVPGIIAMLLMIGGIEPNPGPFPCRQCPVVPETLSSNIRHQRFHANTPNHLFYCPSPNCHFSTTSFKSIDSHISSYHRVWRHQDPAASESCFCNCIVNGNRCSYKTSSLWEFVQHLYQHLDSGIEVECPIDHCEFPKPFVKKSTLQVHLSQYHKDWRAEGCPKPKLYPQPSDDATFSPWEEDDPSLDCDTVPEVDDLPDCTVLNDELVLDSIAKFYLELYGLNLLTFETIQGICKDVSYISEIIHARIKLILSTELRKLGITDDQCKLLCLKLLQADVLYSSHHKPVNGPSLATHWFRMKYFKNNFGFVGPTQVNINEDDPDSEETQEVIPIKTTLSKLLQDPSVQKDVDESFLKQGKSTNEVSNYTEGSLFLSENHPPKEIHLFLYQDCFNAVMNVLGSAKKKYKLLAMYFTIGNLKPHHRSMINTKHLVMIMKESVFKTMGAKKSFDFVLKELKSLQQEGIMYKGQKVKVVIQSMLGDNLGQHTIGGFIECFSACYFCRFCSIVRKTFKSNPLLLGPARSKEDYNLCVLRASLTGKPSKGIKFDSEFNCLQYVHATTHLVVCLAHDLFEGVVSWDLSGIISRFVSKKWFSYDLLNKRIKKFKCVGVDCNNKPAFVNTKGEKLGGHAVQNWTLLRLLPFLISDKISDFDDSGWQMYLVLKELCEFFCAPSFLKTDIPYIQDVLLPKYFELRSKVLDAEKYPLKPKHHYMVHYTSLMLQFGPLIHMWTLAYEQKHKFFKRLMRATGNFINPEYSCAVRHQLNFTYLSSGPLFQDDFAILQPKPFSPGDYIGELAAFLSHLNLDSYWQDSSAVKSNGITYSKEDILLLAPSEKDLLCGQIKVMLSKENSLSFVLEIFKARFNKDLGTYELSLDISGELKLIKPCELKYPVPQPAYAFKEKLSLSLKHYLPEA